MNFYPSAEGANQERRGRVLPGADGTATIHKGLGSNLSFRAKKGSLATASPSRKATRKKGRA